MRRDTLALLAVDFPPSIGGIQTLTVEIYSRLAQRVRVVVAPAAAKPGGVDDRFGADPSAAAPRAALLPVIRTQLACGQGVNTLDFLREAMRLLRNYRQPPCVLHCNHLFAGYAGWWMRVRFGLPYVVWVHGEELSKSRYGALVHASLAGASAILTNSEFSGAMIRKTLRTGRIPPIYKIPLGAPAAWLQAPAPAPATSAMTGCGGGTPIILTVARLSRRDRYKGIDTALEAMAELRRRGLSFRYRIAGEGDDRGYLEALSRRLGLSELVEFLGRVPEAELMAAVDGCDIFLLCSREERTGRGLGFEGFGIVLVEAAARGKAVVAGRSGGIPDAVSDGDTGLLVDAVSPAAVATALERLLLNPEMRAQMGARGRSRVQAQFNWDTAAVQVGEIHDKVCAREAG